jgi:hypothetical protein
MPLYRNGELVGGIGVSGDGVEQDENVAEAGAKGFDAPKSIRVDTVTNNGVPLHQVVRLESGKGPLARGALFHSPRA